MSSGRIKRLPGIEGCSDHDCIFGHPGGMGTNGGCACLRHIYPQELRRRFRQNIWKLRQLIDSHVDQAASGEGKDG
jgi:hypothetical protein